MTVTCFMRITAAATFLTLLVILTAPGLVQAETKNEDAETQRLIRGIEHTYSGRDIRVDFHQTSTLKAIDITEEAYGKAWFSHPGKMKWEYVEPEANQIITDGKTVWIYRPQENQVVTGSASEFFRNGAGGSFLADITQLRKRYTITLKTLEPEYGDLFLVPVDKTPDIDSVVLKISRQSLEILKITTNNTYGDTTALTFSNAIFGPVDPSLFTFTPPEGVDVLLMNQ